MVSDSAAHTSVVGHGQRGEGNKFECEQLQSLQNAITPAKQAKNDGSNYVYGSCNVKYK